MGAAHKQETWGRGDDLAALEAAGDFPPGTDSGLSGSDRIWLSAARVFPLGDEAAEHPDPLVAAMGRLRLVQVRRAISDYARAVTDVASAFDRGSPHLRQTLGASALLSVSRLALRIGAWDLLGTVLPPALGMVRTAPQPRRLSVATGLVAEWALSRAEPLIACVYAAESLYHGSERQRLRGYLGLAYAMAGCWDRARLLCEEAWSAQNLQAEAAAKAPFGALNLIRVEALRAMTESSTVRLASARRRFHTLRPLFARAVSRVPDLHARLALALASERVEKVDCGDEIAAISREMEGEGRWRDCALLARDTHPPLTPEAVAGRVAANACATEFNLPPVWRIDYPIGGLTGTAERPYTNNGLPTVVFCI